MYILYKNPIQLDTLFIVQYLDSLNITLTPEYCIERNHPQQVSVLPSIYDSTNDKWYIGFQQCIVFYEKESKIDNILFKSVQFKEKNPDYRIKKI